MTYGGLWAKVFFTLAVDDKNLKKAEHTLGLGSAQDLALDCADRCSMSVMLGNFVPSDEQEARRFWFTAFHNATLDALRAKGTAAKHEDNVLASYSPARPMNALAFVLMMEGRAILGKAIEASASIEHAEIFRAFLEGRKIDEIAGALNMPIGTVCSILYRVRGKVATYLKKADYQIPTLDDLEIG